MTLTDVILVDDGDQIIGTMKKQQAHEQGIRHRSVMVYVFNSRNELLLQQRAANKNHSSRLWSNTCCNHPNPKEEMKRSAQRSLFQQMGLLCHLTEIAQLCYCLPVGEGLIEHEYSHVFFSINDEFPIINPNQVRDYCYLSLAQIETELKDKPEQFTPWFSYVFSHLKPQFEQLLTTSIPAFTA